MIPVLNDTGSSHSSRFPEDQLSALSDQRSDEGHSISPNRFVKTVRLGIRLERTPRLRRKVAMGVSGQRAEMVIHLAYHKSLCFADFARQPDGTPELSSASTSTSSGSHPATPPQICAATMGKRRKLQNVIKVDLGGIPKSDKIIPVLVQ